MAFSISVSALSKLSVKHLAALKMSVMRLVLTEQSFSLPEGGGPISSSKSYIWYQLEGPCESTAYGCDSTYLSQQLNDFDFTDQIISLVLGGMIKEILPDRSNNDNVTTQRASTGASLCTYGNDSSDRRSRC